MLLSASSAQNLKMKNINKIKYLLHKWKNSLEYFLGGAIMLFLISYALQTFILKPILSISLSNTELAINSIVFAAFFSIYLTHFFRLETKTFDISNKDSFIDNLNSKLLEISYYPDKSINNLITYKCKKIFQFNFLLYDISVQIKDNNALISGPRAYINKIEQ